MQVKILATGIAPDYYTLSGETVTAYLDGQQETYDLSVLQEGDTVTGVSPLGNCQPIRHATRENGVIKATLCQRVGAGHWAEGPWIEAADYNPDNVYVVFDASKDFSGTPTVMTRKGLLVPQEG